MVTRRTFALGCLAISLPACGGGDDRPYLEVAGGTLVFNLRIAQLTYGIVLRQVRPVPEGSMLEASFDMPGQSARHVEVKPALPGSLQYSFESPPLKGARKGEVLTLRVRLLRSAGGEELAVLERKYTVDVDQSTLPSKPLVVGPGYDAPPPE
jgi:hypothetical protein